MGAMHRRTPLGRRVVGAVTTAAAALGMVLALIGIAIAAIVGDAPSGETSALIVVLSAAGLALLARFVASRLTAVGMAAFLARRLARRRGVRIR
jgi:hypothetical protein